MNQSLTNKIMGMRSPLSLLSGGRKLLTVRDPPLNVWLTFGSRFTFEDTQKGHVSAVFCLPKQVDVLEFRSRTCLYHLVTTSVTRQVLERGRVSLGGPWRWSLGMSRTTGWWWAARLGLGRPRAGPSGVAGAILLSGLEITLLFSCDPCSLDGWIGCPMGGIPLSALLCRCQGACLTL